MDDEGRREEEAQRWAKQPEQEDEEHSRQPDPYAGAAGRRTREPMIDYEWRGIEEGRLGRGSSQAERAEPQEAYRDPNQTPNSGGRQRRSRSTRNTTRGLYGSQVDSTNTLRAAIAELLGTFILVFSGTAVAVAALLGRSTAGPGFYDSLAVALAFGLALSVVVAAIGRLSGAHVNPAVTLGLAVTKKFPWQYVPAYLGAQLVGAILGAIATWICYGSAGREVASLGATFPVDEVGEFRAFVVEVLVTFILVFVISSVATDQRAPAGVAPLAVGFALAVGVFIGGPVTGGSLNPARTLGPMIVDLNFTAAWVYVVGPVIGAVLATLVYDRFISQADATE